MHGVELWMIFGGIGAGFSFGLGVLTCYFAFRAGVQLTLRLMKRADEDYSDPFTAEQVPEIQQEVTE